MESITSKIKEGDGERLEKKKQESYDKRLDQEIQQFISIVVVAINHVVAEANLNPKDICALITSSSNPRDTQLEC